MLTFDILSFLQKYIIPIVNAYSFKMNTLESQQTQTHYYKAIK